MNTDPLCPQQHTHPKHNPNRCIFCQYGAAVREDERDKWIAFYSAEIEKQGVQWDASLRQRYREGSNDGKQLGYAAALRDAVAAVEALDDGKTVPPNDGYADAVAAITALGGER